MFHLPNPTNNIAAYFDLGHYEDLAPDKSSAGFTLSIWINILQEMNVYQAILTTMNSKGPGIVFWVNMVNAANDLQIGLRRDSDGMVEKTTISYDTFKDTFGFGIWFHITVSYKFDGSNLNWE